MGKNRVFFPQAALDQWISEGKVDLAGDELTIKAEARRYRILEAARVLGEVTGLPDANELVGKVKTRLYLSELGAELLEDSMVLGDNAYDVVPGFVGAPVGIIRRAPRRTGAVEARRSIPDVRASTGSPPASDEDLLGEIPPRESLTCARAGFLRDGGGLRSGQRTLFPLSGEAQGRARARTGGSARVSRRRGVAHRVRVSGQPRRQRVSGQVDPLRRSVAALDGDGVLLRHAQARGHRRAGRLRGTGRAHLRLGSRFVGAPSKRWRRVLLAVHVTVNVLGDALFLLASGAAVLYLVEERRLKQKRAASMFGRLPPLDALDRAEHWLLVTGFRCSPSASSPARRGRIGSRRLARRDRARALRLRYVGSLCRRAHPARALGWRGRRAAYGTIAGFPFRRGGARGVPGPRSPVTQGAT